MSFTEPQLRALAILPKLSGGLSVVFSGCIVWTILRDQSRRNRIYHRILLGISCCDISASFWLSLSTWPIPSDSNALWAVGSERTCNVQGFFTQLGIASSFYNAMLSFHYVLVIRYNWKERDLKRVEWAFHCIPVLWSITSAICGLALGVYGNALLWCWVEARFDRFRWIAFYGPLWCMIFIVTINCLLIMEYVCRVERAVQEHRFVEVVEHRQRRNWPRMHSGTIEEPRSPLRRFASSRTSNMIAKSRRTREVANQSFLYAGAFYLNWAALTVRIVCLRDSQGW